VIHIRLPRGQWHFDPKRPLGAPGGFGTVFLGASEAGEPVAVKRLHLNAEAAAHRELRMAEELAGKEYRHVMPILDAGQDAQTDRYFVVMPVASSSLQDELSQQGPMKELEAVGVLREVAHGLAELPKLVHRDLKPANVLRFEGRWRVADFGIARFVEESTSAHTLKECLSPQYAAPEQWRLERATPATDVYALGCVAYALLTGQPPFAGSVSELQEQHLHGTAAQLSSHGPQLRAFLAMTLRKQPDARPSIARVIQVLDSIAKGAGENRDSALDKLASAAAEHERIVADSAAAGEKARSIQVQRRELAAEARRTLASLCEQLAQRISESVPTAFITRSNTELRIGVGSSTLEVDWQHSGQVFSADGWPRSGWDVICGAVIQVVQGKPTSKRAANIWYTRQNNPTGDFRWYEVAYESNPLSGRGFEFEPVAVTPELADRAHWNGMDVVQPAYGPFAIDDEDIDAFCQRWTHILAEACAGGLQRLPRALPARGPY